MATPSIPSDAASATGGRPGLGVLDIEVDHAVGTSKFDPNGFAHEAAECRLALLEPVAQLKSLLSDKPAVRYATDAVQLALAPDELQRLGQRALRPHEFLALQRQVGIFFEIHEDFYDRDGVALQPMFEEETPPGDVQRGPHDC